MNQIRNYLENIKDRLNFNSVALIYASKNKGLANSIIYGVTSLLEQYNKIIVLEDDLVTSIDFLQYMNSALGFYQNNKKIWSISGYNLPIKILNLYNHDIYMSYRGCSWGWATWKDRWNCID